jgi:predicted AlkP superfamily pyrophosphatase or phosphodiesterase
MAPKVILISLDGATDTTVDKYLQNGVLDSKTGLGLLKSKGVAAASNETITPSLTAPSHIAIATGSTAVNNDINANSFHLIANPFNTNTSGFAAPIGGYTYQSGIDPSESTDPTANPLWLTLRNAGKTVVSATFPGADGATIKSSTGIVLDKKEDRTVDYTVPFGEFGGQGAKGITLAATDFGAAAQTTIDRLEAIGKTTFSPVLQTKAAIDSLTIGGVKFDFQIAALDTTNDNKTNYDSIIIFDAVQGIQANPAKLPSTGSAFLKSGDTTSQPFYLEGTPNKVGTSFFLSNLAPDLSTVRIARYSANNIPRPADNPAVVANVDDINNNVGFWKPQPDFRIPERLSPGFNNFSDPELELIYQDQVKSFVNYQTDVAIRAIEQNNNADLVMTYIEQPDGAQHQFLLTDPRQASDFTNPNSIGAGQDPAKVARYQKYIETAYQTANKAVQKIIDTVGVDANGTPNSNIIVVSDHGFSPFHTAVSMNNLLKNAGFDSTKVRAITSGPAVNIYINLKGREPNGTVEVAEYLTLQKQVLDTLKGLIDSNSNYVTRSPSTGVFDKVYNREIPATAKTANDIINARGAFVGQDTGDVFALLKTGYNFDGTQATPVIRKGDTTSPSPVFSVPNFYGAHGYDPTLPDLKAIFYAAGPDIGNRQLGDVRNIDVAPTIEQILGVIPAATVEGKALNISPSPASLVSGTSGADNLIAGVTPGFDGINDIIFTGSGNDSVDVPTAGAFVGNNRIDTGSGADLIFVANKDRAFGSAGDDIFEANDAKDYRISAGTGNDTLFLGTNGRGLGGDGNDRLFVGSGGGNILAGGAGADQFWIANAELPGAANTILDFQIGTDVIGIQGAKSLGISATTIGLTQVGADTAINFGGQTLAVLTGIQASSLTPTNAGQFVFA